MPPLPRRTEVNYSLFSIPFPPLCSMMVLVMIWMILLVWHEPLSPTQSDFLWTPELLYDELMSQMQLDVILFPACNLYILIYLLSYITVDSILIDFVPVYNK